MFSIDKENCTGCGECVKECPQGAIVVELKKAEINQQLCIGCGNCLPVCPSGAIHEIIPSSTKIKKGGDMMYRGYGRGFGFRGSSPPWPYIGRGRGGLPRCSYPGLWTGYYSAHATSYRTAPICEDELSILREQAELTKRQLEDIEHRIQELERKN